MRAAVTNLSRPNDQSETPHRCENDRYHALYNLRLIQTNHKAWLDNGKILHGSGVERLMQIKPATERVVLHQF
jgi:hypothetical protein